VDHLFYPSERIGLFCASDYLVDQPWKLAQIFVSASLGVGFIGSLLSFVTVIMLHKKMQVFQNGNQEYKVDNGPIPEYMWHSICGLHVLAALLGMWSLLVFTSDHLCVGALQKCKAGTGTWMMGLSAFLYIATAVFIEFRYPDPEEYAANGPKLTTISLSGKSLLRDWFRARPSVIWTEESNDNHHSPDNQLKSADETPNDLPTIISNESYNNNNYFGHSMAGESYNHAIVGASGSISRASALSTNNDQRFCTVEVLGEEKVEMGKSSDIPERKSPNLRASRRDSGLKDVLGAIRGSLTKRCFGSVSFKCFCIFYLIGYFFYTSIIYIKILYRAMMKIVL